MIHLLDVCMLPKRSYISQHCRRSPMKVVVVLAFSRDVIIALLTCTSGSSQYRYQRPLKKFENLVNKGISSDPCPRLALSVQIPK